MDFTRRFEDDAQALIDTVLRRLEAALQPFADALDTFLAVLFSGPLPGDWRQRWHHFVAEQAAEGFLVEPQSVRELEDWIEAWARYCELLPVEESSSGTRNSSGLAHDAAIGGGDEQNSNFMLASFKSRSRAKGPSAPPPPAPPPQNPMTTNDEGMEIAGPGPDTTQSFKRKVQKALEILNPNVATWWKAQGVQGQVRAAALWFWSGGYRISFAGDEQPVIEVDSSYTAGQTAQAIIHESEGYFADSLGAFYKKYRYLKTGNLAEFRAWQKGSVAEAAKTASVLAELYVTSIATLSPAGDLVVTLGDLADNGPRWDQLLSILPWLHFLPIGAIVLKLGKREVKIPKQLARELEALSAEERKLALAHATAAKSDDEAAAIIKGAAEATRDPEHHIATIRNPTSALRGGPWTPRFEKLFEKAGMTLNDAENLVRVPGHKGPHPEAYHQEIFDRLSARTEGKEGAAYTEALILELRQLRAEILTQGTKLNRLLTE